MKALREAVFLMWVTLLLSAVQWPVRAGDVSPDEEARWLRWLVPLPQEIAISGKRVKLDKHDTKARYFIVADVTGHAEEMLPGGLKGCNGTVWIEAIAEDDTTIPAPRLVPAAPSPAAQATMVKSEAPADGIGVAVVSGGWGNQQMLDCLDKAEEWEIIEEHPATQGLDRVDMEALLVETYPAMDGNSRVFTVGAKGSAPARTAQTKQPVGPVGQRRLVACGLAMGMDERGAEDLTDEARILLKNMVRWAGGDRVAK